MRTRIVFPQGVWEEMLRRFSNTQLETAAYALVGSSESVDQRELLVREVLWLGDSDYDERLEIHLLIAPRFIRSVIRRCEATGLGIIAIHSHPTQHSRVDFSPSDDFGEERELRVFNDFGSGKWPLASLVWGPGGTRARTWDFANGPGEAQPIGEVILVGDRWQRIPISKTKPPAASADMHDRQVRLFGEEGQSRLRSMRVAVIGAGGTGSLVAEMLARLGVGNLVLMDPDILEQSNVSRVFGSTPKDVGKRKVEVLASWLRKISLSIVVESHPLDVRAHLAVLRHADFIFVCTDDDSSRAAINQFAHQYYKPTIELGNRIESDGRQVVAAGARFTYLRPGSPCLECFGSVNHERVREELMPAGERKRLAREGYVTGAQVAEPSIVTLNGLVASLACTKFLAVVNGIGGTTSQRYTYSYLDTSLKAVGAKVLEPCICSRYAGYGDLRPLPNLVPSKEG